MNVDARVLHRVALDDSSEFVALVTIEDLGKATPCGDWSLADLLAHMIGQHRGFTVAVNDHDAPASAYEPVPFDPSSWDSSVAALVSAFDHAALDDTAVLVEVRASPLPISWIVAAQTLDTAVHTWDIAHALGQWYEPPAAVLAAVADLALTIPDGEGRARPGSAFGPALPLDGSPWERTLSQLGRDPRRTSTPHEGPQ
jgi:uncharacterized protein (TIGR03086 family)